MKKAVILLTLISLLLFPANSTYAQEEDTTPQFPGGQKEMTAFITANLSYPGYAIENNIQGQVVVQFAVNADGSLSDIEIVQSPDESLSQEAIRIVRKMPRWIPGTLGGEKIRTSYILPIRFTFNKAVLGHPKK